MIYPNEGFRQQLLDMDPSLTTPEAKADLDRYIMVRCIQGLGLFFPQVRLFLLLMGRLSALSKHDILFRNTELCGLLGRNRLGSEILRESVRMP